VYSVHSVLINVVHTNVFLIFLFFQSRKLTLRLLDWFRFGWSSVRYQWTLSLQAGRHGRKVRPVSAELLQLWSRGLPVRIQIYNSLQA